ncbi:MAG: hypothetical protein V2A54_12270 [Bacteroidota bacterium]
MTASILNSADIAGRATFTDEPMNGVRNALSIATVKTDRFNAGDASG